MTIRNHQHRNNQIIDPDTDAIWEPGGSTTEVILEERLSDGSDTSNPAADHRALFLGEDGLLHLRDSAGTITGVSAAGSVATDTIWDAAGDLAVGTGANTAGRVAIGSNGTVLTSNGTTAGWSAATGGAVYPFAINYFNETKPGSANATYDDEFDDDTGMSGTVNGLDARWNWRNQGTATATFGKAGWLTLAAPAAWSANWRILEIAGFADGTYEAKMSLECTLGNDTAGGIVLVDAVNGDFNLCGFTAESGTRYFGVQKWTNVTTWSANTQRTFIPTIKTLMFVKIIKASAALEVWASEDGIGWVQYRAWNDDVTATRIGLGVNELTNDGKTKLHVDYFRKTA